MTNCLAYVLIGIIKQCEECNGIGKSVYCNNCIKSIDFFEVFRYKNTNNRFVDGESIDEIKAYTWHDAIEFIKNNFYPDWQDLDINCEKEFAYIEEKTTLLILFLLKATIKIRIIHHIKYTLKNESNP
jgi:hypothetical protein